MTRRTTTGLYGRTFLGLLYIYGVLTREKFALLTGLSLWAVDRQLRHLEKGGLVARTQDVAGWQQATRGRPKSAFYLTLPNGVKAGAYAVGIENDYLAPKHYRRIGLPAKTAHRLLGNEYLLAVPGAEEVFSESWPDAPLFGRGTPKTDRAGSPHRYRRIVPDGTLTLADVRYLIEVETGTHARRDLVAKLADYAGRWRRLLRPNLGERKYHDASARAEPVVIITPTDEHKRMRDYLRKHLPETEDWAAATKAITEASGGRAEPGQLIIVAGIDEVRGNPLGRVYRPLFRYPLECSDPSPDGTPGWRVSLADAAEISSRIPVPKKPPEVVEGLEDEEEVA